MNRSVAGSLIFALAVGCNGNDTDIVEFDDLPPIADAGPDQALPTDVAVQLDGRASADPDGNTLTFHWSFDTLPEGSAVADREAPFTNDLDTSGVSSFRPDVPGVYVVRLQVYDGLNTSAPDFVVITAVAPDEVPIAAAGADQTVTAGDAAHLDGSASYDPAGGTLSYAWTLAAAPSRSALTTADVSGATSASATITPDAPGDYVLALVVTGSIASSAPDAVVVHATGGGSAPIAVAGDDATGTTCRSVDLDCSGSHDPDGAPLDYRWDIQQRPATSGADRGAFADADAAATEFYPDVEGEYVLSCSVYDGTEWSVPDLLAVHVDLRTGNSPPDAGAGADRYVPMGSAACVPNGSRWTCEPCAPLVTELGTDGFASDADGDPFVVEWTQIDGDPATIGDASVVATDVSLPETFPREPGTCEDTAFRFRITVTDCPGERTTDTVTLTAECCGTY